MVYDTPAAFRQALETRLLRDAQDRGIDINRLRRGLVFERLLIRLDLAEPGLWVAKGGMALEWRVRRPPPGPPGPVPGVFPGFTTRGAPREGSVEAVRAG